MKSDPNYGKKGNQTLQKFLARGFSLLVRKGVSSTLLEDILTYCDLKKGSFYYYFESKEQFIAACFTACYYEPVLQITQELTQTPGQSFEDIAAFFLAVIDRMQTWLDENLAEHTVPLVNIYAQTSFHRPVEEPSFHRQNTLQAEWVCDVLTHMQQKGALRADADCGQVAQLIDHAWGGVLLSWVHHGDPDQLRRQWYADIALFESFLTK